MDREQLLAALREKLESGYTAYRSQMTSRSAEIVFESAEEIFRNQEIYESMFKDNLFSDKQLDLLLCCDDPLQVLRDQWVYWNDAQPGLRFQRRANHGAWV